MRVRVRARNRGIVAALLLAGLAIGPLTSRPAAGAGREALDRDAKAALESLYRGNAAARMLRDKAKAILVFPHMLKAGFMFGGQIGDGTLFKKSRVAAHYNSVAASYGYQVGAQTFGYALFFMSDSALAYLDKSAGFEVGVGPSIVVVDESMAKTMTTTTVTQDVYAFIFDQRGLMGGLGIQGSKITRLPE